MSQTQPSTIDDILDKLAERVADIVVERITPFLEHGEAPVPNDLIDRKQTLELLNIDSSTLYKWEKTGKLSRCGTIGGKIYYSRSDVEMAMKGILMFNH